MTFARHVALTAIGVALTGAVVTTGPAAPAPRPPGAGGGEQAGARSAAESPEMKEWNQRMKAAETAFRRRDFAKAEAELSAAVKVAEGFGATDTRLANSLARLMQTYTLQGKHAEAVGPAKRLLKLRQEANGPEHLTVAMALSDLASQYKDQGQPAEAKPLYGRALAICEKAGRDADPLRAIVLNNLAEVERDAGNLDAAEKNVRRALDLRKQIYGTEHRWYGRSLGALGTILQAKGRHAEAEEAFRKSLAIRQRTAGWNRPVIIEALVRVADACAAQEKFEDAERYYQRAIRMGEGGLGRDDELRADAYEGYANVLRKTDRADKAAEMEAQAKTIRQADAMK